MNALDDWVNARRDRLTWLDSGRYVRSVFAGGQDGWYDDPATLVAATVQAQPLLRSDVHAIAVLGPFSRHLALAGAAADAPAVCAVLAQDKPRRLLAETIDALLHKFGDRVDIALDCPSPRGLLPAGGEADLDDLDDIAAGLLDVIRTVADRPVRGLAISSDTAPGPEEDETESWSSLLAAARHYGWVTAIRLDGVTDHGQLDAGLPGDLLLLPRVPPGALPDDRRHGGGLPPEAWADTSAAGQLIDTAARRGFRFGEIPHDAPPETVLTRINTLQAAEH